MYVELCSIVLFFQNRKLEGSYGSLQRMGSPAANCSQAIMAPRGALKSELCGRIHSGMMNLLRSNLVMNVRPRLSTLRNLNWDGCFIGLRSSRALICLPVVAFAGCPDCPSDLHPSRGPRPWRSAKAGMGRAVDPWQRACHSCSSSPLGNSRICRRSSSSRNSSSLGRTRRYFDANSWRLSLSTE
jgi:hypothetical protein